MREELIISEETAVIQGVEDYNYIREAIQRLSSASEDQFESIKKEKWYNRVFDMVTFSQKGKKRLAEQIGTLAQAQQVLIDLLLRLSVDNTEISKLVCESMEDIRKLQNQDLYLLSRIKKLENVSLGIKPDSDIRQLSDNGKRALAGCLYYLSAQSEEHSDNQRAYANNVLSFISTDVQMENPISALNMLDSDAKRIILSCCMEYMFLGECTSECYDDYEDFIDEFDIGSKTIKTIKGQIASFYSLRGVEGFLSKYIPENFDMIEDVFTIDIDENIENEVEDEIVERTDEYINSILQIKSGETKTFRNKIMHLSSYINCEGTLEFDNCIINYNETESGDEITIQEGASLRVTRSLIVCKGADCNYFITCKGNNEIEFENVDFQDCSYFIRSDNDDDGINFSMINCELKNCYRGFVSVYIKDKFLILGSRIILENLSDFNKSIDEAIEKGDKQYGRNYMFDIDGDTRLSRNEATTYCFVDTQVVQNVNSDIVKKWDSIRSSFGFIISKLMDYENCSFTNVTAYIYGRSFKSCKFFECENIYTTYDYKQDAEIDNCTFTKCKNVIRCDGKTTIKNCKFESCSERLIDGAYNGTKIEFCEFHNIEYSSDSQNELFVNSIICFEENGEKGNVLSKCKFDTVNLKNAYIVSVDIRDKIKGKSVRIEGCDFMNCNTNMPQGELIKKDAYYYPIFSSKRKVCSDLVAIESCKGL